MDIVVYGAGYVGLVSAVCLASLNHQVTCIDINEEKINDLAAGKCPIYEDQLPALLNEQLQANRLRFIQDSQYTLSNAAIYLIATGTPSLPDGHADLSQLFSVAKHIASIAGQNALVVIKSTVPVGTADAIEQVINGQLEALNKAIHLEVASNPEFLSEGTAVCDFMQAARIIIGGSEHALQRLEDLYQPLVRQGIPLVKMSRRSAELCKYAANAMLACRISFINQISRFAEQLGANIDEVRDGMALDPRIGGLFLQAGIGFGGSCFPKDIQALIKIGQQQNLATHLFQAIDDINNQQKEWIYEQAAKHFNGQIAGLKVGVWGLAFKPGTDDLREASSLIALKQFLNAGAYLNIYDPAALPPAKLLFNDHPAITWCGQAEAVFNQPIDVLIIATEWPEFKNYPLTALKKLLKTAVVIDGRNCFSLAAVKQADLAVYYSVGRPPYKSEKLCAID